MAEEEGIEVVHENQNLDQEIPNQPGVNLRQRIRDPPVGVRHPHIARNQQAENQQIGTLFSQACSAMGTAWFIVSIIIILLSVFYYINLDCDTISTSISSPNEEDASLCQKELERCHKRFEKERNYSEEKVNHIIQQSEESSFVKSDLGEYKTSYHFTLIALVLTWISIFLYCYCLCNRRQRYNQAVVLAHQLNYQ